MSINESRKEGYSCYEEYVDLEGARIWTATQGGGEALVLLHGGRGGHDQLRPVADMIDDLVQVHRYEQRGSGRSTGDPPYTVERWLDDLERLRARWGHDRWVIAWHSFGAELALAYAAAFPERARAVIYMSCLPAVSAGRRGEEEFRANRAARIPEALRDRFFDLRRHAIGDEFLASLRQMERPVLAIHGEQDLRPVWAVERLVEQAPNARLVRLPCGHFPWFEAPAELRRALRTFLSEIVGERLPRNRRQLNDPAP